MAGTDDIAPMPEPIWTGQWPPPEWGLPVDGPNAPLIGTAAPVIPATPQPEATPALQPGLGIPSATVDAALARSATPAEPDDVDVSQGEAQPAPIPALQPGLGIPSSAVDAALARGQAPTDQPAPMPAPGNELERPEQEPTVDDLVAKYSEMPDEQLIAEDIKHQEAAKNDAAAKKLAASAANLRQQQDNLRAWNEANAQAQKSQDAIIAEATRLSQTHIDPRRAWNDRSTWGKITGVIAAVLGGLAAPSMGGRNVGLEMIQKEIDQDIAAQQADLSNAWKGIDLRRGAVADSFARNGNAYQAAEAARLAGWQHVINTLEAQQAQFDPNGTTALRIATTIRAARGKQAELISKQQADLQKQHLDAIKLMQEQQKIAESKREHDLTYKASTYATSVHAKEVNANIDRQRALLPLDMAKMSAEVQHLQAEGKTKEAEALQKFGIPGIASPDGSGAPFVAVSGTPEGLEKLRDKVAATKEVVALLDELRRVRTGWTSNIGNSEENQRLKTIQGQLQARLKDVHQLGALSESDYGLLDKTAGFTDPTKRAEILASVLQARKNVIRSTSMALKAHGYSGEWDIPDLQGTKASGGTAEQTLAAMAKEKQAIADNDQFSSAFRDDARRWLQLYAQGQLPEQQQPITNPDYGKTPEEALESANPAKVYVPPDEETGVRTSSTTQEGE